ADAKHCFQVFDRECLDEVFANPWHGKSCRGVLVKQLLLIEPAAEGLDDLRVAMDREVRNLASLSIRLLARILCVDEGVGNLNDERPQMPTRDLLDVGHALLSHVSLPAPELLLVPAHGVVRTLWSAIQQKALSGILDLHSLTSIPPVLPRISQALPRISQAQ